MEAVMFPLFVAGLTGLALASFAVVGLSLVRGETSRLVRSEGFARFVNTLTAGSLALCAVTWGTLLVSRLLTAAPLR